MRTLSLLFAMMCLLIYSAGAQKGQTSLSIGPSAALPLNFSTTYKTGVGGGIRGYFGVTPQGSVLANVNWLSFQSRLFEDGGGMLTSVKVGYKTNFNSSKFFLYGDGGLIFKSGSTGAGGSDLGIGGGFGYSIPTGKSGSIDVVPSFNIIFQNVVNRTWLDLHLAYRFNL